MYFKHLIKFVNFEFLRVEEEEKPQLPVWKSLCGLNIKDFLYILSIYYPSLGSPPCSKKVRYMPKISKCIQLYGCVLRSCLGCSRWYNLRPDCDYLIHQGLENSQEVLDRATSLYFTFSITCLLCSLYFLYSSPCLLTPFLFIIFLTVLKSPWKFFSEH